MRLRKFYEFVQADFEAIKSFYLKDELNKKIWDNFELDEEVRRNLLQIGQDFFDGSNDRWIKISDFVIHRSTI